MSKLKAVVLIILDGWGYREDPTHNAIAAANIPQWDHWWKTCPHLLLEASGNQVGLPEGQMGNSEVGHMHIGAGQQILQDFTFINHAIETDAFFQNPVLLTMIDDAKRQQKAIHVMGLFSPGGVHSHQAHLFAFLALCAQHSFSNVCLHLFLDGRDTPPKQVKSNLRALQDSLKQYPVAKICSLSGRYWAMDRDRRWPRIESVYALLTQGNSEHHFPNPEAAIDAHYAQNVSDEFFPPTLIGPATPITDGDAVFYYNFRADRAKQLSQAFLQPDFEGFQRQVVPKLAHFVSMTEYDPTLATEPAFPPRPLTNTLGEVLANHSLRQLRIAETEKYAHVTFFFNGGNEQPFALEKRTLIPSPQIATYDLQPEMSAPQLTQALTNAITAEAYDVIICNFANADMVGHSGDFNATVKAIEALDKALEAIGAAVKKVKGHLLITADHGNAECMFNDETQQAHTAHTCEPVPLLYVGDPDRRFQMTSASLVDIAPTILALLNIQPPAAMTGKVLWETYDKN
ncbi:MAG: 2,3-bisphosphoglycerate-independent phosphoglycerate mutase [Gammaproteobacteria bacterium]|nr:2,3-bisphosphoglycerate-independent phosphoglycerate mutase [Gammaproteobacteria bacterium]